MEISLRALPHDVVAAGYVLLQEARDHGSEAAGEALGVLVDALHRARDRAAQAIVDKDRGIREAKAQALNCTDHGKALEQLEGLAALLEDHGRRCNRARLALVNGQRSLKDFVDAQRKRVHTDDHAGAWQVVNDLVTELVRIDAAYTRAWTGSGT